MLDRIHEDFENYISKFVVGQEININESIDSVEDIIERLVDVNLELCLCVLDKSNIVWENIENCCRVSERKKQTRTQRNLESCIENKESKRNLA